jgi:hypothetical protein
MTERITVEQNGERFTLDVPDGTSDEDIQKFLSSQQTTGAGLNKNPEPNPAENAAEYGAQSAATAYGKYSDATGGGLIGDTLKVGKALSNLTPSVIGEVAAHPVEYTQQFIKNYAAGLPMANKTLPQIAGSAIKGVGNSVLAPENAFTLPYNLAAYEQAKIRANPNAPEYKNNPYAMQQRGEAPTQNAAAVMNQQQALRNASTAGNPAPGTAAFQQMQQQSEPPSSANFIQRMHQLADQYLPYKQ